MDTHKSFYLVYQKNRLLTYGMQAFKDWVIEEMLDSSVIKETSELGVNKHG